MTVVEVLKESKKSVVSLVLEEETGTLFIEKILTCPIEPYQKLQSVKSPFLPQIYHLEQKEGKTYVLEEYIAGRTLDSIKPTPSQKLQWITEIFQALEVLHKEHLLHRDVKPSNILLGEDGHIRLIDFDAVREETEEKSSDTRLLGTQGYAPPEQYGFSSTDVRADIYALGVTMKDILGKDWKQPIFRPMIERCTKFSPKKRYSSIQQLKTAWKLRYIHCFLRILSPFLLILCVAYSFQQVKEANTMALPPTETTSPLASLQHMGYYASNEDEDQQFLENQQDDFQGIHVEFQQIGAEFYSTLYYTKQGETWASLCYYQGDSLLPVLEVEENLFEILFDQRGKGRLQKNYQSPATLQFTLNPLGEIFFTLEEEEVRTVDNMSLKSPDVWRNGEFLYYIMEDSPYEDPLDGANEVHPFQVIKLFGQSLYQTWRNDREVRNLSSGDIHLISCKPHIFHGITFTYYEKDDLYTVHTGKSPHFINEIYLDDVYYVKFSEYIP